MTPVRKVEPNGEALADTPHVIEDPLSHVMNMLQP